MKTKELQANCWRLWRKPFPGQPEFLDYPLQHFLICLHSPQRADNAVTASCFALQPTWFGITLLKRPPEPALTWEPDARRKAASVAAAGMGRTSGKKEQNHQERLSDAHSRRFESNSGTPLQFIYLNSNNIYNTNISGFHEPSGLILTSSSPSLYFNYKCCY